LTEWLGRWLSKQKRIELWILCLLELTTGLQVIDELECQVRIDRLGLGVVLDVANVRDRMMGAMARVGFVYALKNTGYQYRFVQWLVLALTNWRKALGDWNSLRRFADAKLQKIVPWPSDSTDSQELADATELHGVAP
jgi:hypothetical protein